MALPGGQALGGSQCIERWVFPCPTWRITRARTPGNISQGRGTGGSTLAGGSYGVKGPPAPSQTNTCRARGRASAAPRPNSASAAARASAAASAPAKPVADAPPPPPAAAAAASAAVYTRRAAFGCFAAASSCAYALQRGRHPRCLASSAFALPLARSKSGEKGECCSPSFKSPGFLFPSSRGPGSLPPSSRHRHRRRLHPHERRTHRRQ